MNGKNLFQEFFSFSHRERVAILMIIIIMTAVFISPHIFDTIRAPQSSPVTDTAWITSLQKLEIKDNLMRNRSGKYEATHYMYDKPANSYYAPLNFELFPFDPNTLSAEGWRKLGLRDKTIRTIQNYLNKGGYFRKPEDLKKIYGLTADEFERIKAYIQIHENKVAERTGNAQKPESKIFKTNNPRYFTIDINTADTGAFISLPGIGEKLAERIINFREKLGGFYSVDQIAETYGLPDSTFQKIKPYLKLEKPLLKKININTATTDELKAHPYISFNIARAIVAYRNEHGAFSKIEDIKKVMVVTDEMFNKIAPYLTMH